MALLAEEHDAFQLVEHVQESIFCIGIVDRFFHLTLAGQLLQLNFQVVLWYVISNYICRRRESGRHTKSSLSERDTSIVLLLGATKSRLDPPLVVGERP